MRGTLLASIMVAVLLAGCTEGVQLEKRDPAMPASTRDSRGAGSFVDEAYALDATNSTPKLHFYKRSMSRYAPDGATSTADRLFYPPSLVVVNLVGYRAPLTFLHTASNNGSLTKADGTFWFRITEPTVLSPATQCAASIAMRANSPTTGAGRAPSPRTMTFCVPAASFGASPATGLVSPGVYPANITLTNSFKITRGDSIGFTVSTSLVSFDQRPVVYFLSGSRIHDSVIHFEGWEQREDFQNGTGAL